MYLIVPLIFVFGVVTIQAESDLVCLGWGIISPVVGLICHFNSEKTNEVEDATVAAVDEAVQSAKKLVEFDLTHNPVSIAYNFLSAPEGQRGQSLVNTINDFKDVTIGFTKESVNQGAQLYNLVQVVSQPVWSDVSFCMIKGGAQLAVQSATTKRKRAGRPTNVDAVKMAQRCLSTKMKQIANPAIFNITEPNQKVGATISDIATLLVPVGAEEKAGVAATDAVNLAIPGSEETTLVTKLIGDDLTKTEPFTNEAEAQGVADSMKDENWAKENCHLCSPPSPQNIITARGDRGRTGSRLIPRGNVLTACCRPSQTISEVSVDYDEPWEEPAETGGEAAQSAVHDSENYNTITNQDLKPPVDFLARDVSNDVEALQRTANLQNLQRDLNGYSTAVTSWSRELAAWSPPPEYLTSEASASTVPLTSSEKLFSTLRKVFTGPPTDPLYSALAISERDGKLRMQTWSKKWLSKTDPVLKPLQDFANLAIQHGKDILAQLQNLTPDQMEDIKGEIEFFYTAPSNEALTGVDPRGFHVDLGILQLAASDTPGLIILNSATEQASRVNVVKDGFQLMKAMSWDADAFIAGTPNGPTWHSVFGPEMAEKGRVSMVMDIFHLPRAEP